jgi:hypothetical protein
MVAQLGACNQWVPTRYLTSCPNPGEATRAGRRGCYSLNLREEPEKYMPILGFASGQGTANTKFLNYPPKNKSGKVTLIRLYELFMLLILFIENIYGHYSMAICSIPDDHIDPRRWALFVARSILTEMRDRGRTC